MKEQVGQYIIDLLSQIVTIDSNVILLAVLLVITVIVLDSIGQFAREKRKEAGVDANFVPVSIDGSKSLPIRNYVSEMQGLAGRPDALIVENGNIIPIERKPLGRKIRDRHIAQLLVYMRLVEEFEGKKPPYGYLIIGKNCRRFKIYNTKEKQAWLQKMIDEMMAALEQNAPVKAAPHPRKCRKCNVANSCKFKIEAPMPQPKKVQAAQSAVNDDSDKKKIA